MTACVVAHDEERTIARCLSALFAQELDRPLSILLIDNASTDRTLEVASRVAAEVAAHNANVTFSIVTRKVNNLGAARQTALETATTPLIAFTDADCVVPPGWLKTMTETLEANLERGVVAVGTANQPPLSGHSFHRAQRLMFSSYLGNFGSEQARTTSLHLREVEHLPTCSVVYDRNALLEAGGFARAHRLVCEDVDVSYRLRAREAKLLKLDSIEVEHHSRPSYRNWARKIFRYGWGQVQIMRKVREHRRLKFLLPIAFALSFPLVALVSMQALLVWSVAYVAVIALASLVLASGRPLLVARMIPLYVITHFSYGAGLLAGAAGWSGGRGSRG